MSFVAAGIGHGAVAQAIALALQVAYVAAVAHLVDAHQFGVFSAAMALSGIVAMVGGLQLDQQVARERNPDVQFEYWRASITSSALVVVLLLTTAGAIALGALPWISDARVIMAYIPAAALQPQVAYLSGLASTKGDMAVAALHRWLTPIFRLTLLIPAGLVLDLDAIWLAAIDSVALLTLAVTLYAKVDLEVRIKVNRKLLRAFVGSAKAAGPLLIAAAAWMLVQRLDVVMLSILGTAADEIARYQVALRVTEVVMTAYSALLLGVIPSLTQSRHSYSKVYESVCYPIGATFFALVALVEVFHQPVLRMLLTNAYVPPRVVMAILLGGVAVHVLSGPLGYMLVASRSGKALVVVSATAIVINVALNLIMIPRLGTAGAAIATSCSLLALNGGYLVAVMRLIEGVDQAILRYVKWVLPLILMGGVVWLLTDGGSSLGTSSMVYAASLLCISILWSLSSRRSRSAWIGLVSQWGMRNMLP